MSSLTMRDDRVGRVLPGEGEIGRERDFALIGLVVVVPRPRALLRSGVSREHAVVADEGDAAGGRGVVLG